MPRRICFFLSFGRYSKARAVRATLDLEPGREQCGGGRRRSCLGDYYEFERFSVGFEFHFIFVEGELDSCI